MRILSFRRVPAAILLSTLLAGRVLGVPSDTNGRIYGGQDAEPGRYGYMVSLQSVSRRLFHFCGGTLIAPDIVLTAARCVSDIFLDDSGTIDPTDVAVRTGPYRLSNPVGGSEIFPVNRIVVHPTYTSFLNEQEYLDDDSILSHTHDIAILHLAGQSRTQPTVVLNQDPGWPLVDQSLTQLGWGHINGWDFIAPDVLQVLEGATLIDLETCRALDQDASWSLPYDLGDDCICTVELDGQGACGDRDAGES